MSIELVIGVDGGGSHTRAWIAHRDAQNADGVIGRGSGGGSNPRIAGSTVATQNIEFAIQAAFDDARTPRRPVAAACIALVGADRKAEQVQIQQWAERSELADRVLITNDALPILYAADRSGVGVALVSGTGSFALGRNTQGTTIRCGGWGPVFGDEGSGYAVACDALRAAAMSADGRGPRTRLLDRLLAHFQIDEPSELIPAIYCEEYGRAEIAQLAMIAFRAAEEEDTVADQIIHAAADQLAQSVCTIATKLGFTQGEFVLSLSGGVLLNQRAFRDLLSHELKNRSCGPEKLVLVREPVAGAVVLAALQ